jgi:endonuclease-8
MPEGHTLHRLAHALDAAFAGAHPAATSPQGRFTDGAAVLNGRRFVEASAWGKHLFVEFDGDVWLNVHLGLIGKFSVEPYAPYAGVPPVWGQVRLRLLTADHVADLRGATICQVVTPDEVDAIVARLGPDPLRAEQDADRAWARIARSSRPVAELLMDQSILAGVGNVYRCEVLYRHRVNPFRPGTEIRKKTWEAIWSDLVTLMALGVTFNQILTMQDQVDEATTLVLAGRAPTLTSVFTDSARRVASGPAGVVARADADEDGLEEDDADADEEGGQGSGVLGAGLERRYYVYKRHGEPCRGCGSKIRTQLVAGRNLFWCGRCQRRR